MHGSVLYCTVLKGYAKITLKQSVSWSSSHSNERQAPTAMTLMEVECVLTVIEWPQGMCLGIPWWSSHSALASRRRQHFTWVWRMTGILFGRDKTDKWVRGVVGAKVWEQGGAELGRSRKEPDCVESRKERVMETNLEEYIATRSQSSTTLLILSRSNVKGKMEN